MGYNEEVVRRGAQLILEGLGINMDGVNFKDTPARVGRAYRELCRGLYDHDEIGALLSTTFPTSFDEMVAVSDIRAVGVCPHHLMPVRYTVHVGYIPSETGMVLGLSKIPRLVQLLAARPVLQEELTNDVADRLETHLKPMGVMVVINGNHSCTQCRGVRAESAKMVTSVIRGVFKDYQSQAREEFLALVGPK